MSTDVNRMVKINSFATGCFRNVADQDYIAARLSYRHGLILQFQTLAHMALEKYIKAILLYNRIKAKNVRHDLRKARGKLREISICTIKLSDISEKFIQHIDDVGNNRYLEKSYFSRGPAIVELDRCVWEIRRFCQVIDSRFTREPDKFRTKFEALRNDLVSAEPSAPSLIPIHGGRLEKLLEKKDHPARKALVWSNAYFASRMRRVVRVPDSFMFENSPYYLFPEILEEVAEYVLIPPKVLKAYTKQAPLQP